MSRPLSTPWLLALGVLLTHAFVTHAAEWVSCRRDASTGQLLWLRGKSTQPVESAAFRPNTSNPDVGTCLISNDQLREAHGLKF